MENREEAQDDSSSSMHATFVESKLME